ncbi:MAG: transposase [Clostridiales bacterium]|jgi:transposase-like protein|nr:transposase [Clostridiales bacterium]
MSYDKKYRKRAIEYHEEGHSIRETAKTFGISPNTLNAWLKQYRNSGGLERKYRSYKTAVSEEELLAYLKINPDAHQSEIGERFSCHQSVICRTLKRFNITRKKR